jgi:hypothetical protein
MSKPSACTAVGGFPAVAAGNRHVLPGHALGFEILLQHVESGGLAARCPPVQNLDLVGMGHGRQPGESGGGQQEFAQHVFLPVLRRSR